MELCVPWITRFLAFHQESVAADLGEEGINTFLTPLAFTEKVSSSTRNRTSIDGTPPIVSPGRLSIPVPRSGGDTAIFASSKQ